MKKIIINIPEVKWSFRPMFDKLLKSLTYEVDETGKPLPENKANKSIETQSTLNKEPKKTNNENKSPLFPKNQTASANNKIQIQKEDLVLISTALIRYKKHLAQNNQLEKAKRVGELDKMFYAMMPPKAIPNETATQPPSSLSERYKQSKRERATNLG